MLASTQVHGGEGVAQIVKPYGPYAKCAARGLQVVLVQVPGVNRMRPIEREAVAPTGEQRCVRILAGKRVNRSQIVTQLIGQPRS